MLVAASATGHACYSSLMMCPKLTGSVGKPLLVVVRCVHRYRHLQTFLSEQALLVQKLLQMLKDLAL
jgi:hypothetical protein